MADQSPHAQDAAKLDEPMEHHPECNVPQGYGICNCFQAMATNVSKPRMGEMQKAQVLKDTFKDYKMSHMNCLELDQWVAVYRKAIEIARQ